MTRDHIAIIIVERYHIKSQTYRGAMAAAKKGEKLKIFVNITNLLAQQYFVNINDSGPDRGPDYNARAL